VLTGELVTLRPIEPEDYPLLTTFKNDVEVERLTTAEPVPRSPASVAERWERVRKDDDSINFAIVTTVGNTLIGTCVLFDENAVHRTVELGITIGNRRYWGRGYGREAVAMLTDYAFRYRNIRKVHLSTDSGNERAVRAYRAAGFVEEGRLRQHVWADGAYHDLVLMGRLREDPPRR
jgi:RimJ/RimL family protein N-acetyltransferase